MVESLSYRAQPHRRSEGMILWMFKEIVFLCKRENSINATHVYTPGCVIEVLVTLLHFRKPLGE